jgi:hypothetical protein
MNAAAQTGDLYVRNVKVEYGSSFTPWIPAPEDTNALASRVTEAESKITADAIINTVRGSSQYTNDMNAKADTSTLTQTADNISALFQTIGVNGTSTGSVTANINGLTVQHSNIAARSELNANGYRIYSGQTLIGGIYQPSGMSQIVMAANALLDPRVTSSSYVKIAEISDSWGGTSTGLTFYDGSTAHGQISGVDSTLVLYAPADIQFSTDGANKYLSQIPVAPNRSSTVKLYYGQSNINSNSGTVVSFANANYSSPPMVFANYAETGSGWSGDNGTIKVYNITSTQATIIVGGTFATSRAINWLTIGT